MSNDKEIEMKHFRIVMAGNERVGKSSIVNQYIKQKAVKNDEPIEIIRKQCERNNQTIELTLVDIQAKKRMSMLSTEIYQNVNGILLVYDVTEWKSFEAAQGWIKDIKYNVPEHSVIILIGNKIDATNRRTISTSEGKKVAQEENCLFMEISARNNDNVMNLFSVLLDQLLLKENEINQSRKSSPNQSSHHMCILL